MTNKFLSQAFTAALGLIILAPVTQAQSGNENFYRGPSGVSGKTAILPIGTTFEGRIQSTISSRSRQGERFAIEISAPVMANGSEVLIPSGSQIQGEVVEAVPSSRVPKDAGMRLHPLGKLRTQLLSLQLPAGMNYPLVASISGEVNRSKGTTTSGPLARKSTVAYVGTQAGFDAVNPALRKPRMLNGQMQVLSKSDMLRDPILGEDVNAGQGQYKYVRSLVKKGRDLYIYSGSPITVRLDAPLKLSFGASSANTSIDMINDDDKPLRKPSKSGRRFDPERSAPAQVQDTAPVQDSAPVQQAAPPEKSKSKKSAPVTQTTPSSSGQSSQGSDF